MPVTEAYTLLLWVTQQGRLVPYEFFTVQFKWAHPPWLPLNPTVVRSASSVLLQNKNTSFFYFPQTASSLALSLTSPSTSYRKLVLYQMNEMAMTFHCESQDFLSVASLPSHLFQQRRNSSHLLSVLPSVLWVSSLEPYCVVKSPFFPLYI